MVDEDHDLLAHFCIWNGGGKFAWRLRRRLADSLALHQLQHACVPETGNVLRGTLRILQHSYVLEIAVGTRSEGQQHDHQEQDPEQDHAPQRDVPDTTLEMPDTPQK